jgi:hypothetical protein
MALSRITLSVVIETARAKHHPMGQLKFTGESISWRCGGHGFIVFMSYGGLVCDGAPCLVEEPGAGGFIDSRRCGRGEQYRARLAP